MSVAVAERAEVELALIDSINSEHEQATRLGESAVEHVIRCGELLTQAKASVGHGGWEAWIETNFDGSQQTANNYMRLFAKHGASRDLPESISEGLRAMVTARRPREVKAKPLTGNAALLSGALDKAQSEPRRSVESVGELTPPRRKLSGACDEHLTLIVERKAEALGDIAPESAARACNQAAQQARLLAVSLENLAATFR